MTDADIPAAHIRLTWTGQACFDLQCTCGTDTHVDGARVRAVRCPHCRTIWELPDATVALRPATDRVPTVPASNFTTVDEEEPTAGPVFAKGGPVPAFNARLGHAASFYVTSTPVPEQNPGETTG